MNIASYAILVGSVLAIAVADVCLKEAGTVNHTLKALMTSPWFLAAVGLYIVQVIGFGYLFISGAKLTSVGIVQTVLYALVVVLSGVFIFAESISITQGIGMLLAVVGVILINL